MPKKQSQKSQVCRLRRRESSNDDSKLLSDNVPKTSLLSNDTKLGISSTSDDWWEHLSDYKKRILLFRRPQDDTLSDTRPVASPFTKWWQYIDHGNKPLSLLSQERKIPVSLKEPNELTTPQVQSIKKIQQRRYHGIGSDKTEESTSNTLFSKTMHGKSPLKRPGLETPKKVLLRNLSTNEYVSDKAYFEFSANMLSDVKESKCNLRHSERCLTPLKGEVAEDERNTGSLVVTEYPHNCLPMQERLSLEDTSHCNMSGQVITNLPCEGDLLPSKDCVTSLNTKRASMTNKTLVPRNKLNCKKNVLLNSSQQAGENSVIYGDIPNTKSDKIPKGKQEFSQQSFDDRCSVSSSVSFDDCPQEQLSTKRSFQKILRGYSNENTSTADMTSRNKSEHSIVLSDLKRKSSFIAADVLDNHSPVFVQSSRRKQPRFMRAVHLDKLGQGRWSRQPERDVSLHDPESIVKESSRINVTSMPKNALLDDPKQDWLPSNTHCDNRANISLSKKNEKYIHKYLQSPSYLKDEEEDDSNNEEEKDDEDDVEDDSNNEEGEEEEENEEEDYDEEEDSNNEKYIHKHQQSPSYFKGEEEDDSNNEEEKDDYDDDYACYRMTSVAESLSHKNKRILTAQSIHKISPRSKSRHNLVIDTYPRRNLSPLEEISENEEGNAPSPLVTRTLQKNSITQQKLLPQVISISKELDQISSNEGEGKLASQNCSGVSINKVSLNYRSPIAKSSFNSSSKFNPKRDTLSSEHNISAEDKISWSSTSETSEQHHEHLSQTDTEKKLNTPNVSDSFLNSLHLQKSHENKDQRKKICVENNATSVRFSLAVKKKSLELQREQEIAASKNKPEISSEQNGEDSINQDHISIRNIKKTSVGKMGYTPKNKLKYEKSVINNVMESLIDIYEENLECSILDNQNDITSVSTIVIPRQLKGQPVNVSTRYLPSEYAAYVGDNLSNRGNTVSKNTQESIQQRNVPDIAARDRTDQTSSSTLRTKDLVGSNESSMEVLNSVSTIVISHEPHLRPIHAKVSFSESAADNKDDPASRGRTSSKSTQEVIQQRNVPDVAAYDRTDQTSSTTLCTKDLVGSDERLPEKNIEILSNIELSKNVNKNGNIREWVNQSRNMSYKSTTSQVSRENVFNISNPKPCGRNSFSVKKVHRAEDTNLHSACGFGKQKLSVSKMLQKKLKLRLKNSVQLPKQLPKLMETCKRDEESERLFNVFKLLASNIPESNLHNYPNISEDEEEAPCSSGTPKKIISKKSRRKEIEVRYFENMQDRLRLLNGPMSRGSPTADMSKTKTADKSKTKTADKSKTKTADKSKTKTADKSKTKTADKSKSKTSVKSKTINPDFVFEGKVYKPRPRVRGPYWVNARLYSAVTKAVIVRTGNADVYSSKVETEKVITKLISLVQKAVQYRRKGKNPFIDDVIKHLYHFGLIKTAMNYICFCMEYLPESYIQKALRDTNDGDSSILGSEIHEDLNL